MQHQLEVPKLNYKETTEKILHFIRTVVRESDAKGVVVGLSGGVDSSLTATLCVRAIGKDNVLGVLMPTSFTPEQDVQDAKELAQWLGIRTELTNIDEVCDRFFADLMVEKENPMFRIPMANIRARTRMIILYYHANIHNYLVAGTGDRSEALIGFFTKYGDGGVDFLPAVHLYKTQVRELAKFLGIPERMAYKPSSPQLYPGHKATDEIPTDYDELDPVLVGLFDLKLLPDEVSKCTNVHIEVINETLRRFNASRHKRAFPISLA